MLHPTRTQATACGWALPSDSGSRFRREQDQGRGFGAARTAVSRASYRISRLEESLSCRPRASAREPVPRPDASLGTGYFADAKFRHDSEHVRAEKPLARAARPTEVRSRWRL